MRNPFALLAMALACLGNGQLEPRMTTGPYVALPRALDASPSPSESVTTSESQSESISMSGTVSDSPTPTGSWSPSGSLSSTASHTPSLTSSPSRTQTTTGTHTVTHTVTPSPSRTLTTTASASVSATTTGSSTGSPTPSACPYGQYYNTGAGACACTLANASPIGSACVCNPGLRLVSGVCCYYSIVDINAVDTTVEEGGVAQWSVVLLHPVATSITLAVNVTLLPSHVSSTSLLSFQANHGTSVAMAESVPDDFTPYVGRAVVVSITVATSGYNDPAFLHPASLPSVVFAVVNVDVCPSGQNYLTDVGCACNDPLRTLVSGVCVCIDGYDEVAGVCTIVLPLLAQPLSLTLLPSSPTLLSVSLSICPALGSSVGLSVRWVSNTAKDPLLQWFNTYVIIAPTFVTISPANCTGPVNVTIVAQALTTFRSVATGTLSVVVSNQSTSDPRFLSGTGTMVPVTVLPVVSASLIVLPQSLTMSSPSATISVSLGSVPSCTVGITASWSSPAPLSIVWAQPPLFHFDDYNAPRMLSLELQQGEIPTLPDVSTLSLVLTAGCVAWNPSDFVFAANYTASVPIPITLYRPDVTLQWNASNVQPLRKGGPAVTVVVSITHAVLAPLTVSCATNGSVVINPTSFLVSDTTKQSVTVFYPNDNFVTGDIFAELSCSCVFPSGLAQLSSSLLLSESNTPSFTTNLTASATIVVGAFPATYALFIRPGLLGSVTVSLSCVGPAVVALFPNGNSLFTTPNSSLPFPLTIPFTVSSPAAGVYHGNHSVAISAVIVSAEADPLFSGRTLTETVSVIETYSPGMSLSIVSPAPEGAPFTVAVTTTTALLPGQYVTVSVVCNLTSITLSSNTFVLGSVDTAVMLSALYTFDGYSANVPFLCSATAASDFTLTNVPAYSGLSTVTTALISNNDPIGLQFFNGDNAITSVEFPALLGSTVTLSVQTLSLLVPGATVVATFKTTAGLSFSVPNVTITADNCNNASTSNTVAVTLTSFNKTGTGVISWATSISSFTYSSGFYAQTTTLPVSVFTQQTLIVQASAVIAEGNTILISIRRFPPGVNGTSTLLSISWVPNSYWTALDSLTFPAQITVANVTTFAVSVGAPGIPIRTYGTPVNVGMLKYAQLNDSAIASRNTSVFVINDANPPLLDVTVLTPGSSITAGSTISVMIAVLTPLYFPLYVYASSLAVNASFLPGSTPPPSVVYNVTLPPDAVCRRIRLSAVTLYTLSSALAYNSLNIQLNAIALDAVVPTFFPSSTSLSLTKGSVGTTLTLTPACRSSKAITVIAPTPLGSQFTVYPPALVLAANAAVTLSFTFTASADNITGSPQPPVFYSFSVVPSIPVAWQPPQPIVVSLFDPVPPNTAVNTSAVNVTEGGSSVSVGVSLTAKPFFGDSSTGSIGPSVVTVIPSYFTGVCVPSGSSASVSVSTQCSVAADCPRPAMSCVGPNTVSISPPQLNFTSSNWNVSQTIRVTAVNDLYVEGVQTAYVTFTFRTNATGFRAPPTSRIVVNIFDNDVAGLLINSTANATYKVFEGISTDYFSLRLSGQPFQTVVVNVTNTDVGQLAVTPALSVFDSSNWNVSTVVSVSAVDDGVAELISKPANVSFAISAAATVDSQYQVASRNASKSIVTKFTVVDSDVAGFTATPVSFSSNSGETSVICASGYPALISDAVCSSMCSPMNAALGMCVTGVCDCRPITTSVTVNAWSLTDAFMIAPTSILVQPVTVTFKSSNTTRVNTTVNACTGAANGSLITYPALTIDPPSVTFAPTGGPNQPVLIRVAGFRDGIPKPTITAFVTLTVSSLDPLYSGQPEAAACLANVLYNASNSQGQCPPPLLPNVSVTVMSSQGQLATTLLSAVVSSDGASLVLTFSGPTTGAALPFTCSSVFTVDTNSSVSLCSSPSTSTVTLGSGATCAFLSSSAGPNSVMLVTLGAGANLTGGYIRLLPGPFTSYVQSSLVFGRVPVAFTTPVAVSIELFGSETVGSCDGIVISALASPTGPNVVFFWSLTALTNSTNNAPVLLASLPSPVSSLLLLTLMQCNTNVLVLSPLALSPGFTYSITVGVTNGGVSNAHGTFSFSKSFDATPTVWIDAPFSSKQVSCVENDGTFISAVATVSLCAPDGTALTVFWLATNGSFPIDRLSPSNPTVYSPTLWNPNGLPVLTSLFPDGRTFDLTGVPAGVYGLQFCALLCVEDCVTVCDDVTVNIRRPPLAVTVNGVASGLQVNLLAGQMLLVPNVTDNAIAPLPLDGAAVVDVWTCTSPCTVLWNIGGNATVQNAMFNTVYAFTFTRNYTALGILARFTGSVVVYRGPTITLQAESTLTGAVLTQSDYIFPWDSVLITANVEGDYNASAWSCPTCGYTFQSQLASNQTRTSLFSLRSPLSLKISAAAVTGGDALTIQFAAMGPVSTSVASLTLRYTQPLPCFVNAEPNADLGLLVLSVSGCYPMNADYRFGLVQAGLSAAYSVWLTDWVMEPTVSVHLPPLGNWVAALMVSNGTHAAYTQSPFSISELVLTQWSSTSGLDILQNAIVIGSTAGIVCSWAGWNAALNLATITPVPPLFYLASTDQKDQRSTMISQFPTVYARTLSTDEGTAVALALLALATQVDAQLSLFSTTNAASYLNGVITDVSARGGSLSPSAALSGLSVISSGASSQSPLYGNSIASYNKFVQHTVLPLIVQLVALLWPSLVLMDAPTVLSTPMYTAYVGLVDNHQQYSMHDLTGANLTAIQFPSLNLASPATMTGGEFTLLALVHTISPYGNGTSIWKSSIPVSSIVSVLCLSDSGSQLTLANMIVPYSLTFNMSGVTPSSPNQFVCVMYNAAVSAMSRVGCVTQTVQSMVTCFCNRTGDVVVTLDRSSSLLVSTSTSFTIVEGSSVAYNVSLAYVPAAAVSVSISAPTGYCLLVSTGSPLINRFCNTSLDCGGDPEVIQCLVDTLVTVSPSIINFSPLNWATAISVTVTAFSDEYAEDVAVPAVIQHTLSSIDPLYDAQGACITVNCTERLANSGVALMVNVIDSNAAGLVNQLYSELTSGVPTDIELSLTSQPIRAVNATFVPTSQFNGAVIVPSTIWFTPELYGDAVNASVVSSSITGTFVASPNPAVLSVEFASEDPAYNSANSNTSTSDSTVSIPLSPSTPQYVCDSADVALYRSVGAVAVSCAFNVFPTASVTLIPIITGLSGNYSVVVVSPSVVSLNWFNAISETSFTLFSPNDGVYRGSDPVMFFLTFALNSSDSIFTAAVTGAVASVSVRFIDDVTPGILSSLFPQPFIVEEGGAVTFALALSCTPIAPVNITCALGSTSSLISSVGQAQALTISPAPIVFTPSNWNVAKPVTVFALDDVTLWPWQYPVSVSLVVSSLDSNYAALPSNTFEITVSDNDVPSVICTPSFIQIAESGPSAAAFLWLATQPQSASTISLNLVADPVFRNRITIFPEIIQFDASDWSTPQEVWISAPNDHVDESYITVFNISVTQNASTTDSGYAALSMLPSITIAVTDTPGSTLAIAPTRVILTENASLPQYAANVSVTLQSQPLTTINVTLVSPVIGILLSVSPGWVTVSPSNWLSPHVLTLSSIETHVFNGSVTNCTLTPVVMVTPLANVDVSRYTAVALPNVSVSILSDDTPDIVVNYTAGLLSWALGPRFIPLTVSFTSKPLASVTLALFSMSSAIQFQPQTVIVAPTDWNKTVVMNVTLSTPNGLSDFSTNVDFKLIVSSSGDPYYNALPFVDMAVQVVSGLHASPVAVCDSLVVHAPGELVTIDASSSYDPEGSTPLSFNWSPIGVFSGTIDNTTAPVIHIAGLIIGQYSLTVTVTNTYGLTSNASVVVLVSGVLSPPLLLNPLVSGSCYSGKPCVLQWALSGWDYTDTNVTVSITAGGVVSSLLPSSPQRQSIGSLVFIVSASVPIGVHSMVPLLVVDGSFGNGAVFEEQSAVGPAITVLYPYQWRAGGFTPCSATCGVGQQTQTAQCVDLTSSVVVTDDHCASLPNKPLEVAACFGTTCPANSPLFYYSGPFGVCNSTCGPGYANRTVLCLTGQGSSVPLSQCAAANLTAPVTVTPCSSGPCEVFSAAYVPASVCAVACGTGTQTLSALCTSSVTLGPVSPFLCAISALNASAQSPCSTGSCAGSYRWVGNNSWTDCTATCGGGLSTRGLVCQRVSDGSLQPASACAGVSLQPQTQRVCNTQPCTRYAYDIGPWSICPGTCGGTRGRTVSCLAISTATSTLQSSTRPCATALGYTPSSQEACPSCGFCSTTACSGHGVCFGGNSTTANCNCTSSYSGTYCQMLSGCSGPFDISGGCCPAGSVLGPDYSCCTTGVLDASGQCCETTVNACGVCGGPSNAIIDATGACCVSASVDASGLCCVGGNLDVLGVCDGLSTTMFTVANGTLTTVAPITLSTIAAGVALALGRPMDSVTVVTPLAASTGYSPMSSSLPPGSFPITLQLTPFGGPNFLSLPSLPLPLPNASLLLAHVSGGSVCGNGVCEVGERAAAGSVGCPSDCPLPLLFCPLSPSGRVCGGTGVCIISPLASVACVCWTGYTGDACTLCAPGFVPSPSSPSLCTRLEVPVSLQSYSPSPSSIPIYNSTAPILPPAAAPFPLVLVSTFSAIGFVCVVLFCLFLLSTARKKALTVMSSEFDVIDGRERRVRPAKRNSKPPRAMPRVLRGGDEVVLVSPERPTSYGVFMHEPQLAQPTEDSGVLVHDQQQPYAAESSGVFTGSYSEGLVMGEEKEGYPASSLDSYYPQDGTVNGEGSAMYYYEDDEESVGSRDEGTITVTGEQSSFATTSEVQQQPQASDAPAAYNPPSVKQSAVMEKRSVDEEQDRKARWEQRKLANKAANDLLRAPKDGDGPPPPLAWYHALPKVNAPLHTRVGLQGGSQKPKKERTKKPKPSLDEPAPEPSIAPSVALEHDAVTAVPAEDIAPVPELTAPQRAEIMEAQRAHRHRYSRPTRKPHTSPLKHVRQVPSTAFTHSDASYY